MSEVLDKNTIKALAVEQRQEIMKLLAKRPYTASEIAKISGKHVTTIGQHLDVLEKSGLVKKKDSDNKWVYYQLAEKGERLFKPQFYSWVIVFSVSLVLMSIGMLRLFAPIDYSAQTMIQPAFEKQAVIAPVVEERTGDSLFGTTVADNQTLAEETSEVAAQTVPITASGPDLVAISLITLGIFGMGFVAYSKVK